MPARKQAAKKVKSIERDDHGLITQPKVDYVFTDDGFVDWRKMVKEEFLVPNRQKTQETDVSKLEDHQLIILLGGIKELAQIRGYTSVKYDVTSPSPEYVVATCSITWTPNYETEGKEVTFSAIGDASPHNTQSFARFFLGPIAENRAFVRCVRNFLKINIVGQEELGNLDVTNNQSTESSPMETIAPSTLLKSVMKEKNVSFEAVQKVLLKEGHEKAEGYTSVEDIPKDLTFTLIQRIKNKK
tara:strand:- start:1074 stop:1802 length:729 start_codon:yes stop_codon:yes gene_type:complete